MKMKIHRSLSVIAVSVMLAACGADDSTGPEQMSAGVEGTVEETTPGSGSGSSTAPAAAPGADAETVAVVSVGADGSLTTVAEAQVEADGSYSVQDVLGESFRTVGIGFPPLIAP